MSTKLSTCAIVRTFHIEVISYNQKILPEGGDEIEKKNVLEEKKICKLCSFWLPFPFLFLDLPSKGLSESHCESRSSSLPAIVNHIAVYYFKIPLFSQYKTYYTIFNPTAWKKNYYDSIKNNFSKLYIRDF